MSFVTTKDGTRIFYEAIDVPTLIIHGDDDRIVPIGASAEHSARIVPNAKLKIYEGADHGLIATHQDRFNADLLAFIHG